ncbi:carbohydrate sulfotransferase 11-like isoform X1 [Ptychodera flava]|uniref:carbohydrate sulfotransferase 11-like isoform X1 n=1 Tax=Ptychodera flava TaxID=63121 RepID=UPI00396A5526
MNIRWLFMATAFIVAVTMILLLLESPTYKCSMQTSPRRSETVRLDLNHSSENQTLVLGALPLLEPHRHRILTVTEGCRTIKEHETFSNMNETALIQHLSTKNFLLNREHKIMFCLSAKTGESNWRRAFLILAGTWKKDVGIHAQTVPLFRYSRPTLQKMALSFTKIMFVRHPFERLLSAYLDKIIEKPQDNFLERYGEGIRNSPDRNGSLGGYDLSFDKFVNYFLTARPENIHWNSYYKSCDPCLLKYDFIGKLDTIYADVDYLSSALNVTFDYAKTAPHATHSSSRIRDYYSLLTKQQILGLYSMYYNDFKLFGFPYPDLYLSMALD